MSSIKNIALAPVALTGKLFGGSKKGASEPLLNPDGLEQDLVDTAHNDTSTYNVDDESINTLISLELALHLIHADKESLGRVLVITANTDMTKL